MEGKFRMELLVVSIGVGMIFWHLERMTLESDEVDSNGMPLLQLLATPLLGLLPLWAPGEVQLSSMKLYLVL